MVFRLPSENPSKNLGFAWLQTLEPGFFPVFFRFSSLLQVAFCFFLGTVELVDPLVGDSQV